MQPLKISLLKRRLVEVEFLDHCINDGDKLQPITCTAVGVLIGHCKNAFYIASWMAGPEVDQNTESFTILKSTVTKMVVLKRGGHYARPKNKKAKR